MKELDLNSDQKAIVAYLNETTSETFQDLTLKPNHAYFNPFSLALDPSMAESDSAQPPLFLSSKQYQALHN